MIFYSEGSMSDYRLHGFLQPVCRVIITVLHTDKKQGTTPAFEWITSPP